MNHKEVIERTEPKYRALVGMCIDIISEYRNNSLGNATIDALEETLTFTLHERVSKDLQEAALMHFRDVLEYEITKGIKQSYIQSFKKGAEWQKDRDKEARGIDIASGRESMRLEMMQKAIQAKVVASKIRKGKVYVISEPFDTNTINVGEEIKVVPIKD